MANKFVEDSSSDPLSELQNQHWDISRSRSSILRQLHKLIIVVCHYYGSLVKGIKLIHYRLAMVSIKVVILKQLLEHISCHSMNVETIANSLSPRKCSTSK